jgi:hypothetical protein
VQDFVHWRSKHAVLLVTTAVFGTFHYLFQQTREPLSYEGLHVLTRKELLLALEEASANGSQLDQETAARVMRYHQDARGVLKRFGEAWQFIAFAGHRPYRKDVGDLRHSDIFLTRAQVDWQTAHEGGSRGERRTHALRAMLVGLPKAMEGMGDRYPLDHAQLELRSVLVELRRRLRTVPTPTEDATEAQKWQAIATAVQELGEAEPRARLAAHFKLLVERVLPLGTVVPAGVRGTALAVLQAVHTAMQATLQAVYAEAGWR